LTAASNPSTSSPNITMAATVPSWVLPGYTVTDVTAGNKLLGTVLSGAGSTTLVLAANSAFVGSGSSNVLTIADPNVAALNTLIANLS
jgi:homoserine kinase